MSGLCLTPTPMLTKLPYSIFTTLTDFINYCWRNSYWTSLTQNWTLLKISPRQTNHTNWFAIRINLCYLAALTLNIIQEIAPRIDFLSCAAYHIYVHFTQRHGHFVGQTLNIEFFSENLILIELAGLWLPDCINVLAVSWRFQKPYNNRLGVGWQMPFFNWQGDNQSPVNKRVYEMKVYVDIIF